MDCSQFKSGILAFREHALPEAQATPASEHLASCAACRNLMSEFDQLDELIERDKAATPNPFAGTRILQRIENELGTSRERTAVRWSRILTPVVMVIALLFGLFIGTNKARNDSRITGSVAVSSENVAFLRTNLLISEFADEDKILVLNK